MVIKYVGCKKECFFSTGILFYFGFLIGLLISMIISFPFLNFFTLVTVFLNEEVTYAFQFWKYLTYYCTIIIIAKINLFEMGISDIETPY